MLLFLATAVTNILHRNLNFFILKLISIMWATLTTFLVSLTMTYDGYSLDHFKWGRQSFDR